MRAWDTMAWIPMGLSVAYTWESTTKNRESSKAYIDPPFSICPMSLLCGICI